jgi:branched-chain amino acid transport system substrate-binding protein
VRRIYASLPLSGPLARPGHDLLRGAQLALERNGVEEVELLALDSFDDDRDARAAFNAGQAAEDPDALAYLGDFHSSQVLRSAPVLEAAGLLAVAPLATFVGLEGQTLIRLSPHDGVGARAIAAWVESKGVERLLVVHDRDFGYGVPVGTMSAQAARERGVSVDARPVWNHDETMEIADAQAVLYVGVAGSGAVGMWRDLHRLEPSLWLLGSEGVADERLVRELDGAVAERTRFFVAQRAPIGFYGYEAMALILSSLGPDREATVRAARATRERESVLGRYSIDPEGHTSSTAYGCLAVRDGQMVWAEPIAG